MYLVRHGATDNNLAQPPVLQGRNMDPSLSPKGQLQAECTASLLASRPIGRVIASPLIRSQETAGIIALPHQLDIEVVEGITEVDVGNWEGRDWGEIERNEPVAYRAFMDDPGVNEYPGGESFSDVNRRVTPCFEQLMHGSQGQEIIVVAHNVVNRSFIAGMLGLPLESARNVRQENGAVNVVRYRDGQLELIMCNSALHLADL